MATPGISRRTILHGAAATLAGLASRSRTAAAQAPRVLRIRIEKDPSALDPAFAGTRSEHAVVWAISNRLTMFKPTGDRWDWQNNRFANSFQNADCCLMFRFGCIERGKGNPESRRTAITNSLLNHGAYRSQRTGSHPRGQRCFRGHLSSDRPLTTTT